MSRKEKHLSRTVEVVTDGVLRSYPLTIAEVTVDDEGIVTDVRTEPYTEECAGVTYHDTPIRIETGRKLNF